MAGRQRAPGPSSALVAAAYALAGSVRKAAAQLGVSKSTVFGILKGQHGAGAKTQAGLERSAQKPIIERTARSLQAGRTPAEVRQAAKERAASERAVPGMAQATTEAHERAMADQGLDVDGNPLQRPDGRAATAQELMARYQRGEIDFNDERYRAALMRLTGQAPPVVEVDRAPMFEDLRPGARLQDSGVD